MRMNDLSMRGMATRIGISVSVISRLLNGHQKRIDPEIVSGMARALQVDRVEVMRRLGQEPGDLAKNEIDKPRAMISYACDSELNVTSILQANEWIDAPANDLSATRMLAPGSPFDGWLLFHNTLKPAKDNIIGRLMMVSEPGRKLYIGTVSRGYAPGKYGLNFYGITRNDVEITQACPIDWINPNPY